MSDTNIPPVLVSPPTQMGLATVLAALKKDILLTLNCHHLGTIQSFDPTKQTATVTINYQKTVFTKNTTTNQYQPVRIPYPTLTDCPVLVLSGGGGYLSFPVKVGDECVVMFNDRDIDNWFQGSDTNWPATNRKHSLSDGLVLVGPRALDNLISGYDAANVVLMSPALVKIANPSFTLGALLQDLITQLNDLTTALAALTVTGVQSGGALSGPPSNAATITNIGNQITTIGTHLGSLLS